MSKIYLTQAIEKFSNTGKGNKVLQHLSETKQLGWEKWMQYELAFALTKLGSPTVEYKFTYDKTASVSSSKSKFENGFIDIIFRKKSTSKEYYTALELKLGSSNKIVRALLSDLIKISASKRIDWQYRTVMAVGFLRDSGMAKNKFSRGVQNLIEQKFLHVKPIKNTDFKLLVMGWSEPPRKASRENYKNWLQQIENTLKSHNVRVKRKKVTPMSE